MDYGQHAGDGCAVCGAFSDKSIGLGVLHIVREPAAAAPGCGLEKTDDETASSLIWAAGRFDAALFAVVDGVF